MLEYGIFALTVVMFLIFAVIFLLPGNKKITTIPGLEPVDALQGNFPDISSAGSLHEFLLDIHSQYGPIASFWWGPKLCVSIATPELFKEHAKPFDRPVEIFQLLEPLIGDQSIQFANGPNGRQRHAVYSKCFSNSSIRQYYELFQKLSRELVATWRGLPKDEHIPLQESTFALAIKGILTGTMGKAFEDSQKINTIRKSYNHVWNEMEDRLRDGTIDIPSERQKRFDENKAIFLEVIGDIVDNRRRTPPGASEFLLVDAVLELDLPDTTRTSDLITNIIGGFHTTGYTLTWALYFLAAHQDVQDKLYAEIKQVVGQSVVDHENITKLKYLGQVLDETLRCGVVANFAARFQDVDTELGGYRVPAGTPVIHALGVCLQDPKIFPEPKKFDPERFSAENVKNRSPFAFQPFGFAGKRKCLGYRFAMAESSVLIVEIIRSLRLELVEGQVVTPVHGLMTAPKEEIWVTVSER